MLAQPGDKVLAQLLGRAPLVAREVLDARLDVRHGRPLQLEVAPPALFHRVPRHGVEQPVVLARRRVHRAAQIAAAHDAQRLVRLGDRRVRGSGKARRDRDERRARDLRLDRADPLD
jgi:hypothetical protein